MASVRIPTPLRSYTANQESVTVSGATVGEALSDLTAQFPALAKQLYHEGELRSFVNVFVGEEDIRHLQGPDTPISEEDRLMILASVAGGLERFSATGEATGTW